MILAQTTICLGETHAKSRRFSLSPFCRRYASSTRRIPPSILNPSIQTSLPTYRGTRFHASLPTVSRRSSGFRWFQQSTQWRTARRANAAVPSHGSKLFPSSATILPIRSARQQSASPWELYPSTGSTSRWQYGHASRSYEDDGALKRAMY